MKAAEYIIRDPQHLAQIAALIAGLDVTKPKVVEIKQYRKKRTLSQNALYHKWVGILCDHFGYEHDEMCEELKRELLPPEGRYFKVGIDGSEREFRTTTKLTTKPMGEYMTAIDRFAAQHGVILPHPEDQHAR